MNKALFFLSFLALTGAYCSPQKQIQTPVVEEPVAVVVVDTTPVVKTVMLNNINDSASYAVGVSVANFYKQQGIKTLNTELVSKAINDIMSGGDVLMDDAAANSCMNNYMTLIQTEKSKPRMDSGTAFLEQNKTKSGIITTASGLQYEIITAGTGIKPTAQDSVTCNYMGTLLDGTEFDNSYKRGEPITFNLGGVIRGWTEGLQLMSEGAKYKFYVPYALGYGAHDYGPIPGGSVLIFEVDLLKVIKSK